jgi:hypothetical protein
MGATARAKVLRSKNALLEDTDWFKADGKLCGESLVSFDANTVPGLHAKNWEVGTLTSDYFYGGKVEYD